jgi:hypothetical protein
MDRVYLKDGRERIGGGLGGRKRKKGQGALGKTPVPFLSSIQNWGGRQGSLGRQRQRRPEGRRRPGIGENGEGGRGLPIPTLTLVGDGLWRWLRGEEWAAAKFSGDGTNGGGGGTMECCGGSVVR